MADKNRLMHLSIDVLAYCLVRLNDLNIAFHCWVCHSSLFTNLEYCVHKKSGKLDFYDHLHLSNSDETFVQVLEALLRLCPGFKFSIFGWGRGGVL